MSALERHKTPPWEVLGQVAAAVQRLLDTGNRPALDDEKGLATALGDLDASTRFQPEHFKRKEVNAQLRGLAKSAGGAV